MPHSRYYLPMHCIGFLIKIAHKIWLLYDSGQSHCVITVILTLTILIGISIRSLDFQVGKIMKKLLFRFPRLVRFLRFVGLTNISDKELDELLQIASRGRL